MVVSGLPEFMKRTEIKAAVFTVRLRIRLTFIVILDGSLPVPFGQSDDRSEPLLRLFFESTFVELMLPRNVTGQLDHELQNECRGIELFMTMLI